MVDLVNAAPQVIDQGIRDLSTRQVPRNPLAIPQHLPVFYGFFSKGRVGRHYVDLSVSPITQLYGDKSFDVNSKYYTHVTPFLQAAVAQGNNVVVHRLVALDAKDVANKALYIDVLEQQVPLYVKNSDGSLQIDEVTGEPVVLKDAGGDPMTIAGYSVGWVTKSVEVGVGEYQRGSLKQEPGIQTGSGGQQSIQYPIYEFSAKDVGEDGMSLGVKLYAALQSDLIPFPTHFLSEGKNYPYYFGVSRLADEVTGQVVDVLNTFGGNSGTFINEPGGINPSSGAVSDIKKIARDLYVEAPPHLASGLDEVFVYEKNLEEVLGKFYASEAIIEDEHRDIEVNGLEENIYAINIASFVSSNGSPYQSLKLVDLDESVRLTRNTNLFLEGASDGTISEELLDRLVAVDIANYADALHPYNDLVAHPESIIYDTGFSLDTKKALPKFISRRKDTFLVLSTFSHDVLHASIDQQYSLGVALKTMLDLYPESSMFGTSVARGMVCMGSGEIPGSLYTKRVPASYSVAVKAARYMGAADGHWKAGFNFDRAPGSVIQELKNIDITWVPASTRNTLWAVGLNFILNYQINSQFFPALKTVYENDTSVLNSFFVAVAACYLNKVAHASWREFSGSISLDNDVLTERVNSFITNQVKDRFDNNFVIIPDAHVTELDELRGYSWTTPIKLYANNMKTVSIVRTETYRMSDLAG